MRLRHVMTASLLALSTTSCSLENTEDTGSINVYIGVDKSTVPVGESVTITVTARNVGYAPLTLTGPSNCLLFIEILTNSGLVIWRSNVTCASDSVTETLEAGENKVQSFSWDGTNQAGGRLGAGFYHIRPVARVTAQTYIGPLVSVALE